MKTPQIIAVGLTAGALSLVSCTPQQQQYGVGGALGGAALGAIAGGDSSDVLTGAALGAAGGVGVAAYQENKNQRQGAYNTGGDHSASQYPKAFKTSTPGVVISPYKPHNKVRVTGMAPGSLAKDPDNKQIFMVP